MADQTEVKLPESLEALPRMTPGIFKGQLAMFPNPHGLYVRLSDAESALKARDAEIERLRGDAERYRWLREEAQYFPAGRAPAVVLCDEHDLMEKGRTPGDWGFVSGKKLDAAIDAAIDQARAEGGEKEHG